jgi:hypothetical protein
MATNDYKLGNIELYLGLKATGKTVTIDNSGTPIAAGDTTIPVTGADLADIKKANKIYVLQPVGGTELIYVTAESLGDLTVRRDVLKQGAKEIADGVVLNEMVFVKRVIADDFSINSESLVNPQRVISHDGVEEILFGNEEEEVKVSFNLLNQADYEALIEACPIVSFVDKTTNPNEEVTYQKSAKGYKASEHVIPAMVAFSDVSYNEYVKVFPKLTLLTPPEESYSPNEVYKMSVEMSALKQDVTKPDGEIIKASSWSVKEVV